MKDLPNIAAAGIVVYDGRCLFLKRNKPPLNWGPPAGKLRTSESFAEGIVREVREEAGLDVTVLMCVEAWIGKPVDRYVVSATYVCLAASDKVDMSDEHADYRWVPIEDLADSTIDTDFDIKAWPAFIAAAQAYGQCRGISV